MWLLPTPTSPSKAAMNFWCMTLMDSCVCFWDAPKGRILGAGRLYTLCLSTSLAAAVHMPTNRAWGTLSPTLSLAVGMIWFPVLIWISQMTEKWVVFYPIVLPPPLNCAFSRAGNVAQNPWPDPGTLGEIMSTCWMYEWMNEWKGWFIASATYFVLNLDLDSGGTCAYVCV